MRRALLVIGLVILGSGCLNSPEASPPPEPAGTLEVHARAGPVCPVETVPPDPACAPRPVAGARVVVSPADGRDMVVASGGTDADGTLRLSLAPGEYLVTAAEVEGLFGRPAPVQVSIAAGETSSVTLDYDTGIR